MTSLVTIPISYQNFDFQIVAGALTAMCAVGCLLYCFTVPPPPLPPAGLDLEDEDEEQPLLAVSVP